MAESGAGPADWRLGKDVLQCHQYMLENGIDADVTLIVGRSKTAMKAHRYILLCRSKTLCDKLSANNSTEVQVLDVEPEIMEIMLKSMYYNMNKVTPALAIDVLSASLRYNIHELAVSSAQMVKDNITLDNVFLILEFSYIYAHTVSKEKALDFFYKNSQRCMSSDQFINLPLECVLDLLKSGRINLKAERIYESVMRWAEAECVRQGRSTDMANKKEVCGPEIPNTIKFVEMEGSYFMQNISKSGFLSPAEEIDIFHTILNRPLQQQQQVTVTSLDTRTLAATNVTNASAATNVTNASVATNVTNTFAASTDDTEQQTSAKAIENLPTVGMLNRSHSANMSSSAVELESGQLSSSQMVVGGARVEKSLPPRTVVHSPPRPQGVHPVPHDVHLGVGRNTVQKIEIQRFQGVLSGKAYMRENHDGISFISSHKIKLHGIYVYGSHQIPGKYSVTIKILEDRTDPSKVLQKAIPIKVITKEIETNGRQKQYLIEVDPPQVLKGDILYTIDMLMKGPVSFYGRSGKDFVLDDDSGVMLSFVQYELALGGTNVEIGQLPGMVIQKVDD